MEVAVWLGTLADLAIAGALAFGLWEGWRRG